jgi:hypothetical protein
VGVYWQSYGRIPSGREISGLEEEFELSHDLSRLLYTKEPAPDREPRLEQLIFRISQEASYRRFDTSDQLERLLRDLASVLSERLPPAAARGLVRGRRAALTPCSVVADTARHPRPREWPVG